MRNHAPPEASETARAMLPGVRPMSIDMDIEAELLLANLLRALQHVKTTALGHHDFIRSVRGERPVNLSQRQCDQVRRLAWRYRLQLPRGLRPARDPDLDPTPTHEAH